VIFANARYVKGRIREAVAGAPTLTRFLVFDAEGFGGMDASGVEALQQILKALRSSEIELVAANVKSFVQEKFDATRLTERIGPDRFFPTIASAVDWCSGQNR
jgi:MFS superfamily sulfate permease-like transporter